MWKIETDLREKIKNVSIRKIQKLENGCVRRIIIKGNVNYHRIRFKDLTTEQRNFICNGCGGKGGFFKPPDFLEFACCNHHDFNYWLGYQEKDRKKADKQFYDAMITDVNNQPFYFKIPRWLQAKLYYLLVRKFGKKYFHYGICERNSFDLNLEMEGTFSIKTEGG